MVAVPTHASADTERQRATTPVATSLAVVLEEAFALWRELAAETYPVAKSGDAAGEFARIRALRLLRAATACVAALGGSPPPAERLATLVPVWPSKGRRAVGYEALTPREVEVLRLLAEGRTDREVAAELAVSPRTVTTHVTSIFNKLGVATRTAAVARAIRGGLI